MELFWPLLLLSLLLPLASAEQIPDYDNPYSPIITDQRVYSWTDKVKITILAPSWNSDRYLIDDIGADPGNFLKISTRGFSLEPYRLTETGVNNGIFTGEVILTGFLHDVDGDGDSDTVPRTSGSGPTDGFLETDRDSAITISFEFADGIVVSESVPISWNVGTVQFLENAYTAGQGARIRVADADMNLNPEGIDKIIIGVYSDSDAAGLEVDAVETHKDSGVFEAAVLFGHDGGESRGNLLFSKPGDRVFANYEDRTLPPPYGTSDELDIVAQTSLASNVPPASRYEINSVHISDGRGNILPSEVTANRQVQIVGDITNNQDFEQPFTYFVQVKNDRGMPDSLSWVSGTVPPGDSLAVSQSWMPTQPGSYSIESFVWEPIPSMNPLSAPSSMQVLVR